MSTRSTHLHSVKRSLIVIVDIQEKLTPVIPDCDLIIRNTRFLLDVAGVLAVPAIVTEQYPKGLGSTVPELAGHVAIQCTMEKHRFSACEAIEQSGQLQPIAGPQLVLAGIETHICILQTAFDLLACGYSVTLVVDATGSRGSVDQKAALDRMQAAGVTMTTAEAIAFEWCEQAGSDAFRSISRMVRERKAD